MAVGRRQNDHVALFAAGGKQDAVLRVERQARATAAFARNIVVAHHLHRVRVDHRDGGLVFNVDIDFAVAVGGSLLGRAANVDGAQDRAVLVVEHGDVRRRVAEDVEAVIVGVVQVAVGIALDVDLLDHREGLRVEHRHRFRGRESVARRRVHRSAMRAGAGNVAHLGERVEIEDADVPGGAGARHDRDCGRQDRRSRSRIRRRRRPAGSSSLRKGRFARRQVH